MRAAGHCEKRDRISKEWDALSTLRWQTAEHSSEKETIHRPKGSQGRGKHVTSEAVGHLEGANG